MVNIFVKSPILQIHLIVSYLAALLQENRSMIKAGGGINVPGSLELLVAPDEAKKRTSEIKALGVSCQVIPGM